MKLRSGIVVVAGGLLTCGLMAAVESGCGTDAGGGDAGSDASSSDSSVVDASDAGSTSDASTLIDAGSSDSGSTDAGKDACGAVCYPSVVANASIYWLGADDDAAYFVGTLGDGGIADLGVFRTPFVSGTPTLIGPGSSYAQYANTVGLSERSVVGNVNGTVVAWSKDGSDLDAGGRVLDPGAQINRGVTGRGKYVASNAAFSPYYLFDESAGDAITNLGVVPNGPTFAPLLTDTMAYANASSPNTLSGVPLPPVDAGGNFTNVTLQVDPNNCVVGGTKLVCASGGKIVTVPLASLSDAPTSVTDATSGQPAADAKLVVFYDSAKMQVLTCPLDSACAAPTVIASSGAGTRVALAATQIVYYDPDAAQIKAVKR